MHVFFSFCQKLVTYTCICLYTFMYIYICMYEYVLYNMRFRGELGLVRFLLVAAAKLLILVRRCLLDTHIN